MWAIRESSAGGFGVRRARYLGCEWKGVDRVATSVDGERFEARHEGHERNGVEVKAGERLGVCDEEP